MAEEYKEMYEFGDYRIIIIWSEVVGEMYVVWYFFIYGVIGVWLVEIRISRFGFLFLFIYNFFFISGFVFLNLGLCS